MIVLDTSAIIAVLADEPERPEFVDAVASTDRCLISTATLVEIGIVVAVRFGPAGSHYLSKFLARAAVESRTLDAEQADAAVTAYQRFGKGRHPVGLNFGDCFSYALAHTTGAPLLYKGNDFAQTDIPAAV